MAEVRRAGETGEEGEMTLSEFLIVCGSIFCGVLAGIVTFYAQGYRLYIREKRGTIDDK